MTRRHLLSSSADFDDPRYWQFARSSGLPLGYFGRRRTIRARHVLVAAALLAVIAAPALLLAST